MAAILSRPQCVLVYDYPMWRNGTFESSFLHKKIQILKVCQIHIESSFRCPFQYKDHVFRYSESHYEGKLVIWPFFLYIMGNHMLLGGHISIEIAYWSFAILMSAKVNSKWLMFLHCQPSAYEGLLTHCGLWRQRSGSTLAQVMVCCLMAPSHYLNQCWLIISEVQCHSY